MRRGDEPPADATIIIRADELDPEVSLADARDNHTFYGFYGISVFADTLDARWFDRAVSSRTIPGWCFSRPGACTRRASSCGTQARLRTTTLCTRISTSSSVVSLERRIGSIRIRSTRRDRDEATPPRLVGRLQQRG